MQKTTIEWTRSDDGSPGYTSNPIRARDRTTNKIGWHCVKISTGCTNCYSSTINDRFGTQLPYNAAASKDVELFVNDDELASILRCRKTARVFLADMTDLFQSGVTDDMLDRIFAVMAFRPNLTFQILTKRAARMEAYFRDRTLGDVYTNVLRMADREPAYAKSPLDLIRGWLKLTDSWELRGDDISRVDYPRAWPLPNCWLGVSVEDQKRADERIPHLLQTPAAIRFLSVEPLLGPTDLSPWLDIYKPSEARTKEVRDALPWSRSTSFRVNPLHWIVTGGESGPNARPMHPQWARDIRDQCIAAGVPYFHKQNGEYASVSEVEGPGSHYYFPDGATVRRVGKKLAGRTLDGRTWDQFPTTEAAHNA